MFPNNFDSGFTNIMQDETLRNDYLDSRYDRLNKGLSGNGKSGMITKRTLLKNRIIGIILMIFGTFFGGTFGGSKISFGDKILSSIGISPWSDGSSGIHYSGLIGVICFLIGIGFLNSTLSQKARIWVWCGVILIYVILGLF